MMMNILIPHAVDYDAAIESVNGEVLKRGIHDVIKQYRFKLRNSSEFHSFLSTHAADFLQLEPRGEFEDGPIDKNGNEKPDAHRPLIDSDHRIANVALAGAVISSLVNRRLFPEHVVYSRPLMHPSRIEDEEDRALLVKQVEVAGGIATLEGQMLALHAVGKDAQSRMGESAVATLAEWSTEMAAFARRFDDIPDASQLGLSTAFSDGFGYDSGKTYWYYRVLQEANR